MNLEFDAFTYTEHLRENSQTGGIIMRSRQRTGKAILPWIGLKNTPDWMKSERAWVTIDDRHDRIACCGLYLRVESPKSSEFYNSNKSLLEHIAKEKSELESRGYVVVILGDFKARIESLSIFKLSTPSEQQRKVGCRFCNKQ